MHIDDRALVNRVVGSRDEEAFRLLFRRHTPRLYALARRLLGPRADEAEDTVQEAWLRAAARLEGFEWRSSLPTWLSAFVINCARERLRARLVEPTDPATLDATTGPARPAGLGVDLDRAIARLPDGYREVLVLHDVEGYTHEEIGQALGIVVGTSKSQLFHARRAMRAHLAGGSAAGERS